MRKSWPSARPAAFSLIFNSAAANSIPPANLAPCALARFTGPARREFSSPRRFPRYFLGMEATGKQNALLTVISVFAERPPGSRLRPGTQRTPQIDQLTQMIGVVIGQQKCLAQYRLPISVRKHHAQIRFPIAHQFDHFVKIVLECFDALFPGGLVRRYGRLRPVALGKSRRDVLGVAAEFQNVPLRNAHMLD